MSTDPTPAQVDEALARIAERIGEGGIVNHAAEILAAEVRRLRDERENWRVSSVAREAVSRAEQAEAKLAALVATGDAMKVHLEPRRVGFSTNARDSVTAWDAAKSGAQVPDVARKNGGAS